MEKIIKIVDFIEEKTEELKGEILSPLSIKNINIIKYIERRIEQLNAETDNNNSTKLSNENEINFLTKLKKRIANE